MKIIIPISCLLLFLAASAQDTTVEKLKKEATVFIKKDNADTVRKVWRKGGFYNFNIAQGSLTNWAAGGDDFSLSVNSYLNLFAFYKKDRHSWDNTLDSYFGYINTTSLGGRKNDDRLDLLSKYEFGFTKHLNLATLFNFRTQFFKGYTYSEDVKTFSSAFLSPAYLLLSEGIDYKPTENLSFFFSPVTSRLVIVKDDSLAAKGLYGVAPGKHVVYELGAFVTINFLKDLSKTVSYKGRLDLFSNYRHNPQNIDVFMTNAFFFKVSRIITANWNIDLIYDDDVRLFGQNKNAPALQLKSLVGFGVGVKF